CTPKGGTRRRAIRLRRNRQKALLITRSTRRDRTRGLLHTDDANDGHHHVLRVAVRAATPVAVSITATSLTNRLVSVEVEHDFRAGAGYGERVIVLHFARRNVNRGRRAA